jgi:hypothetical protein
VSETTQNIGDSPKLRRQIEVSQTVQNNGDSKKYRGSPKFRKQPKVSERAQCVSAKRVGGSKKRRRDSKVSETLRHHAAFSFLRQIEDLSHGASGNFFNRPPVTLGHTVCCKLLSLRKRV